MGRIKYGGAPLGDTLPLVGWSHRGTSSQGESHTPGDE